MFYDFLRFLPPAFCIAFGALLSIKKASCGHSTRMMGATMFTLALVIVLYTICRQNASGNTAYLRIAGGYGLLNLIPMSIASLLEIKKLRITPGMSLLLFLPPLAIAAGIAAADAATGRTHYRIFDCLLPLQLAGGYLYTRRLLHGSITESGNVSLRTYPGNFPFSLPALAAVIVLVPQYGATGPVPAYLSSALALLHSALIFLVGRDALRFSYTAAVIQQDTSSFRSEKTGSEVNREPEGTEITQRSLLETLDIRLQQLLQTCEQKGVPLWQDSELTLDKLAAQLQTNRTYISRLFNDYYGIPFAEYINSRRIAAAERLLADNDSDYTMEWIAIQAGFASMSSFYRVFKTFNGVSPGVWRNGQRRGKTA